jgi:hypothetical protein
MNEMSDYDYLALKLVQTAERFPNRIGPNYWVTPDGRQCLVGCAGGARGEHIESNLVIGGPLLVTAWADPRMGRIIKAVGNTDLTALIRRAVAANDAKVPWGQIPKLLGLVPGEADAQDLDSVGGVDRGRISAGVPAVSEPAQDGVALSLAEV